MARHIIISTLAIIGMIMALGMGIGSEQVRHITTGLDIIKGLAEHATESAGGLAAALVAIYSIMKIIKGNPPKYDKPERRAKHRTRKVSIFIYIVYGSVATLIVLGIIVAAVVFFITF